MTAWEDLGDSTVYKDDGSPHRLRGILTENAIALYGVTHYSPTINRFYFVDPDTGKHWQLCEDERKLLPLWGTVADLQPLVKTPVSTQYNAYQIDVSDVDIIDVYEIHNRYKIDDPSGAIQHASKKLLLAGTRTGNKPKYKDIKEARDTLNRWLEMNDGS